MPIYLLSPSTILVVEVILKLNNMIDKKIEEAARLDDKEYYDRLSDNDKCFFEYGFRRGYNRALKDLLHPASEEPNHESTRTYILGKTKASESGVLPMLLRPNTNWKEFVVSHGVTHWLYVDDLFPKKGGE